MKFCEICGDEIFTKAGENRCSDCESDEQKRAKAAKRAKRNAARRAREQALRDIGMTKVRGNLGSTFWE